MPVSGGRSRGSSVIPINALGSLAGLGALCALGAVVVIGAIRMRTLRDRVRMLEAQAITDPLTGAYNRRHMDVCRWCCTRDEGSI